MTTQTQHNKLHLVSTLYRELIILEAGVITAKKSYTGNKRGDKKSQNST